MTPKSVSLFFYPVLRSRWVRRSTGVNTVESKWNRKKRQKDVPARGSTCSSLRVPHCFDHRVTTLSLLFVMIVKLYIQGRRKKRAWKLILSSLIISFSSEEYLFGCRLHLLLPLLSLLHLFVCRLMGLHHHAHRLPMRVGLRTLLLLCRCCRRTTGVQPTWVRMTLFWDCPFWRQFDISTFWHPSPTTSGLF